MVVHDNNIRFPSKNSASGYRSDESHSTVGSDEKFQIPGQEIIFEISGPGPSYLSIGTSQDHIWSYFEHMCWSAQVEWGGV